MQNAINSLFIGTDFHNMFSYFSYVVAYYELMTSLGLILAGNGENRVQVCQIGSVCDERLKNSIARPILFVD